MYWRWSDILIEANHKTDYFNIDGKLVQCLRGQSIKSLRTWGERWGVNQMTVKRFLNRLKKDGFISIENLKRTTRLTVLNYNLYQKSMLQLKPNRSESYKDERYDDVTTYTENLLQLQDSLSEGCKDECYNLDEKSVTNRSKEDSYIREDSLKNSLEKKDLDKEFEEFEKSPEAEKLFHKHRFPEKQTPHDRTH